MGPRFRRAAVDVGAVSIELPGRHTLDPVAGDRARILTSGQVGCKRKPQPEDGYSEPPVEPAPSWWWTSSSVVNPKSISRTLPGALPALMLCAVPADTTNSSPSRG